MKKGKWFIMIFSVLLLTGCWDERLLRNSRTVYMSGLDFGENERYRTTAIIRDMNISESSRGEISITNQLEAGEGNSIQETGISIERSIAGNFDPAKGRVFILGNEVAQENIYNTLDSIYRNARMNINARVIVAAGSAEELISHLLEEESEKGEYLYEMIRNSEEHTESQIMTQRSIRTYLFDEGRDFTVPYLGIDEESNKVEVQGSALFNGQSFTGSVLSPDDSTMLLLFMGDQYKKAILTEELDNEKNQFISFNVKDISKEQQIKKEDNVQVDITIQLNVEVGDFPPDHLDEEARISFLNEQLSKILTQRAESMFEQLATNRSDVLGLGRELIAYYPKIWEKIKGEDYYDHIRIIPKVKVRVTSSGAIL